MNGMSRHLRIGALTVTLERAAEAGGLAGPTLAVVVGHLLVTSDLAASLSSFA